MEERLYLVNQTLIYLERIKVLGIMDDRQRIQLANDVVSQMDTKDHLLVLQPDRNEMRLMIGCQSDWHCYVQWK